MAFAVLATMFLSSIYAADFTSGNLVVVRVGTGSGYSAGTAAPVFLEEYTTTGALVQTIAIPTTGAMRFTNSISATSEGAIALSPNGKLLTIAGYDADPGTASVGSTTSTAVPRKILGINKYGEFIALSSTTAYTQNNIRSAVSNAAGDYWAAGNSGTSGSNGIQYFGNGTPAQVSNTITNTRVVNIYNGQLFFSSASGAIYGIYKVGTGTPVTSGETSTNIISTGANSSPYAFAFDPANSVCYIADDRTNGSGGIQKWTSSNGTDWTLAYTISVTSSVGARGLTVDWRSPSPVIYATTTNNKLVSITDTGASSTVTELVTLSVSTPFRGVAFAPYTDPTTLTENVTKATWTLANNTLNFDVNPTTQIEVYSVTGSKMAVYEPAQQINLNLSKGVYILKVNNTAEKFMIQ